MKRIILSLFVLFLSCNNASAQNSKDAFTSTGYPVPRFVSIRSGEAYARTGPGKQYPIRYVYQRKNLPVEIVLEYEGWRKIRDQKGEESWVHNSLLSGKRTGLIKSKVNVKIMRAPESDSKTMAEIESGAIVEIEECLKGNWCKINAAGYKGWIMRKNLWGIYQNEFFD